MVTTRIRTKSFKNMLDILQQRLRKNLTKYTNDSPQMIGALYEIGNFLVNRIKLNIRRKKIVDQGQLLNSIRFDIRKNQSKTTLSVGSFGVKYAAINEFGGDFTPEMRRAMFYHLRNTGRLNKLRGSKGVIQGDRWKARPYIGPSVRKNQKAIIQLLEKRLSK